MKKAILRVNNRSLSYAIALLKDARLVHTLNSGSKVTDITITYNSDNQHEQINSILKAINNDA